MLTDSHTHSRNSFDADKDTVEDRCEQALKSGITAMAITDHCEANRFYPPEHYGITHPTENDYFNYRNDFEKSIVETLSAREKIGNQLTLICGVELGQGTADEAVAEMIYSREEIDFVIGSMHELPGKEDFYFLDYSKENIPQLMTQNFNEIYRLCKQDKFDVLGHLTYALRYIEGEQGHKVELSNYKDIIAEIFKVIIKNRKGIEINTSGLRQKYGRTFPSQEYVNLYRELGGKIITFGSDCHSTADLGAGIVQGMEIARKAGFDKGAYYLNHEPHFFDL